MIERPLGLGGMATVYLGRDLALDRAVALKVLAEELAGDKAFRDRFLREARLAARLVHPNVVQVYDVGEDDRGPFIVMEYVEGGTLADELRRRTRLPAAEVVEIGIQLCSALEAAHAERLVHRDIKPQNILLRPDGRVKVADFGIARSLAATRHTELGTVLGTAAYLAPEQARGEPVTAAADIYSLGVVLYELLTGRAPVIADTLPELILKREQGAITPPGELADVPPALEAVVMRCLALRPEYRPVSAAALAYELANTVGDPATGPLAPASGFRAADVRDPEALIAPLGPVRHWWVRVTYRQRKRHLLGAAVAIAVLALAVALAVAVAGSDGGAGPRKAVTHPRTTTTTATAATTAATMAPVAVVPGVSPPASTTQPRTCFQLDRQQQALDANKHAIDEGGKGKGHGHHDGEDGQKHALDQQRQVLDQQLHELGCD